MGIFRDLSNDDLLRRMDALALDERRAISESIACLEEVAYRMGFIDAGQLQRLAEPLRNQDYGRYLLQLVQEPLVP